MRLLIRADGDRRIGAGHVMRAIALAEHARAAADEAAMLSVGLDDSLRERAEGAGLAVRTAVVERGTGADAAWVVSEARRDDADWVVLDGGFDPSYQAAIGAAGRRILLVDDSGQPPGWTADVVLNQNVMAAPGLYPGAAAGVRFLFGPRFALLRQAFGSHAPAAAVPARAQHVLVTMGGADPVGATERVLAGLACVADPGLRVRAVVGPANPRSAEVAAACDSRTEVVSSPDDMPALMEWADLAISAAGSTIYELCSFGVPTLVVAIVPSHVPIAEALERESLAINLGWHDRLEPGLLAEKIAAVQVDRRLRATLGRSGRARIDGRGADRVLGVLRSIAGDRSAHHA